MHNSPLKFRGSSRSRWTARAAVLLAFWLPSIALGVEMTTSRTRTSMRLESTLGGSRFKIVDVSFNSAVADLRILGALSDRTALGLGMASATSLSDGKGLYNQFSVVTAFALTGKLAASSHTVALDGRPTFRSLPRDTSGFRAAIMLTQYQLHGTTASVPFSGFGGRFGYDHVLTERLSVKAEAGLDQVVNNDTRLQTQVLAMGLTADL